VPMRLDVRLMQTSILGNVMALTVHRQCYARAMTSATVALATRNGHGPGLAAFSRQHGKGWRARPSAECLGYRLPGRFEWWT
jgi:hypothetical protein